MEYFKRIIDNSNLKDYEIEYIKGIFEIRTKHIQELENLLKEK